jgi:hypothetical protein
LFQILKWGCSSNFHFVALQAGMPDFSSYIIPNPEKMYQMNAKFNKWS